MRLLGLYMGSVAALLLGCGVFFVHDRAVHHEQVFDEVALCEARGGEWVSGAEVPLCMTQNDGLLELVDGSFVAFTSTDPWNGADTSPFAGEILGDEGALETNDAAVLSTDCGEHTIAETYAGKIAAVDFSSWPEAVHYRTAINKDVARGVNFAGQYVVSTWGCGRRKGDACVGHAVVDARTGRILLYGEIGKKAADFSLTSNRISLTTRTGDEMAWTIEDDRDSNDLIRCTQ